MATQRAKTEKIDLNPKRVQNPFEHLKRSPGKFDQRVYMEQELTTTNRVRFYDRLYSTQQRSELSQHEKHIAELQRKGTALKARNEEYAYLMALRAALNKEKQRRLSGAQTARPATPDEVRKRFSIERRNSMFDTAPADKPEEKEMVVQPLQTESLLAAPTVSKVEGLVETIEQVSIAENTNAPPPVGESAIELLHNEQIETETTITEEAKPEQKKKKVQRRRCPVSPHRLATLESLSYEIMTNTLPIAKMKRILPEEHLSINEKWPILSNYRKQTVLPSVKVGKQRVTDDMNKLHTKLNEYFKCDNFPLRQYKYIPPDYPTKYRLLKAIETEQIHLPTLPKH